MSACVVVVAWWVGVVAFGAAMGTKTVEVEGEKMSLDAKEFTTKQPVEVTYKLYTATRGPDKVLVCGGSVRSNLPHEWYKITVRIRVFNCYKDANVPKGVAANFGCAEAVIMRPKPGNRQAFQVFVKGEDGKIPGVNLAMSHLAVHEASFEKVGADDK
jgi:hypothetical protein